MTIDLVELVRRVESEVNGVNVNAVKGKRGSYVTFGHEGRSVLTVFDDGVLGSEVSDGDEVTPGQRLVVQSIHAEIDRQEGWPA